MEIKILSLAYLLKHVNIKENKKKVEMKTLN